jgi:thioredoxin 2
VAVADIVRCENCGTKNRVPADAVGIPQCGRCHEPLPWTADADEGTFASVVEAAALPVLVDLWAPWCGPCRMVSPALEELARAYRGRVKLVKVNVDEAPGLAARFGVQGVPTLLLMDRGEVVARQTGAAPESALRTWLDQALAQVGSATA